MKTTAVGLDLAKNVFQVHGIDAPAQVCVSKALRRRQVIPFFGKLEPCLVGIEACGPPHDGAGTGIITNNLYPHERRTGGLLLGHVLYIM